jgi:ankyrin repeat protein
MELPTPLLRAIERRRPENIRLLLDHGANPNGVPIETEIQLARIHRRFATGPDPHPASLCNPITVGEVGNVASQFIPITEGERTERRAAVCQFWMEPHREGIDYSSDSAQLHSVVRAGASTPEILDVLLCYGDDADDNSKNSADARFWKETEVLSSLADEKDLSPSSLAISTPLHSAIAFGNMSVLRSLLASGFDPNARAMIAGSLALTPSRYAILVCDYGAYSILGAHPNISIDIRTPVFGIHILHFAVALLSEEAVDAVGQPFSKAGATGLGHIFLHVACLPYRDEEIAYTPKIQESIHETRNLHNTQFKRRSFSSVKYNSDGKKYHTPNDNGDGSPTDIPDELHRQDTICRRIIHELGTGLIGMADSHGNTALHYLAGSWYSNESLVAELRAWTTGEFAWQNYSNLWGRTPKDLMDENLATQSDIVRDSGKGYVVSRGMKQRMVLRGMR